MGGFGSGRNRYATTPTVEECRHLDVNKLKDIFKGDEECGNGEEANTGVLSWGDGDDYTVGFRVEEHENGHEYLHLKYTTGTDHDDGVEQRKHEYPVRVEYTPCNFGGERPWFRCPRGSCHERVAKLYNPPRGRLFLCRDCHELSYLSSRVSGCILDEPLLRYRRAFEKADKHDRRPHPESATGLPEKPKGMHEDTFEDLLDDVRRARWEFEDARQSQMRELLDRSSAPTPSEV